MDQLLDQRPVKRYRVFTTNQTITFTRWFYFILQTYRSGVTDPAQSPDLKPADDSLQKLTESTGNVSFVSGGEKAVNFAQNAEFQLSGNDSFYAVCANNFCSYSFASIMDRIQNIFGTYYVHIYEILNMISSFVIYRVRRLISSLNCHDTNSIYFIIV